MTIAAERPLVELDEIKVHFPIKGGALLQRSVGAIRAVDGVSLAIARGETLGLVGESGSGKSTLGRTSLLLSRPTEGRILFDGQNIADLAPADLRSLRRRMRMVFQDPLASLNPRHSIGRIVSDPLRAHGVKSARERDIAVHDLLKRVGLPPRAARRYPHEFSGGQLQRVGIARALALEPDFIVADEPVSSLDVSIQAQILNLLQELQSSFGITYLFVAHDLAVVRQIATRVAVMYLGAIVEIAPTRSLYSAPLHPYTMSLLAAVPVPDPRVERTREVIVLRGDPPSPANPPSGCRFHTRCPYVQPERCHDEVPETRELAPAHEVACHYADDIRRGLLRPMSSPGVRPSRHSGGAERQGPA